MNYAHIVGNLGADPELRYTQGGTAVCNLRIATNETKKDGDNWVKFTEWHNVVVWGRQAENCEKFLEKGRTVAIRGRLQTREWEKDGSTRYTTEIVADQVEFLNSGSDAASKPRDESAPDQQYGDVDIPF